MSTFMIDLPPETKWDRFLSQFKKINPAVQAAIIAGIFSLGGIWLGVALQSSGNQAKISRLEKQVTEQESTISKKTAEIQRLETLLTPFRTIALERYTGPESEALNKLAAKIDELQKNDLVKTEKIEALKSELARTNELAKPPTLELLPIKIVKSDNEIVSTIRFQPSKNQQLGTLVFLVELPDDSKATIIDFWPTTGGGAFQSGKESKFITENKRASRLVYALMSAGYPSMELKLSAPTQIKISGNYIEEPIITEVK